MNRFLKIDPWRIIENSLKPTNYRMAESYFTLGNGRMGLRGGFEEKYMDGIFQGSYVGGIYTAEQIPPESMKNGGSKVITKMLEIPNWSRILIEVNGRKLNLKRVAFEEYKRVLNMKQGDIVRSFIAEMSTGERIKVSIWRMISMVDKELAVIRYSITPLNFSGEITFISCIDGNARDKNDIIAESSWNIIETKNSKGKVFLMVKSKQTPFKLAIGIKNFVTIDDVPYTGYVSKKVAEQACVGERIAVNVEKNSTVSICKYVAVLTSLNHSERRLLANARAAVKRAEEKGVKQLFKEHKSAWEAIWRRSDITLDGDESLLQALRFSIFQLNQAYSGNDTRLNISDVGYTGDKKGGRTSWHSEIFYLPFFLGTAPNNYAFNLLLNRYKQLDGAILNAVDFGCKNGAALFSAETINGDESALDWITVFGALHRNTAIVYAIYRYLDYTGDIGYLEKYGLKMLVATARFWVQRIIFSEERQKYIIQNVIGPNEYETMSNNNWYTNKMVIWSLEYTISCLKKLRIRNFILFHKLLYDLEVDYAEEVGQWQYIVDNFYLPENKELGIAVQQDGYLEKKRELVADIGAADRPLYLKRSWDYVLRSNFVQQADVLLAFYLLPDEFDNESLRRNFDFYEARTVHEAPISYAISSVLAMRLGDLKKSEKMLKRLARANLDNKELSVQDGLDMPSMAATWLTFIEGVGGMRVKNGKLFLNPHIYNDWNSYSFKFNFRKNLLQVMVMKNQILIFNEVGEKIELMIVGKFYSIEKGERLQIDT